MLCHQQWKKALKQSVSIVGRVSGKTRFETSVAIADKYYSKQTVSDVFFCKRIWDCRCLVWCIVGRQAATSAVVD